MATKSDDNDIERELRDVESQLRRIEKQSKFGSEDQFFFGMSFSLLILFITLPMDDAEVFLQNAFTLSSELAATTAIGIRVLGIVTALVASLLRYYGSMCSEHVCKEKRLQSIFALLTGFWFFVFIIGENMLYGIALKTSPITIPLGAVILGAFYLVMTPLEKRMLNFYALKGLILKADSRPVISPAFVFLCGSLYFSFFVGFFASLVVPQLASLIEAVSLVTSFALMMFLYIGNQSRRRIKDSRRKSAKTVQKRLVE